MNRNSLLGLFFFALLATGVLTRTPAITFMSMAVGFSLLAGQLWARSAVEHMDYEHFTSLTRCMTGDEMHLETKLENPTFLPLPWVEITDLVPQKGFHISGADGNLNDHLTIQTGMSWFQRVRRRYTVQVTARGFYQLGPVVIRIWDPLGLTFAERRLKAGNPVLVYPICVPMEKIGITADDPFGDPEHQRWLFRDPFSVAGARPYQPGDPLRHIHWPATATTGEMMSRQMEGTRSPDLLIFVNLRTMETAWHGTVTEFLELSLCTAASVARYATRRGYRVGLFSNGNLLKEGDDYSAPPLQVPPSSDPRQLRTILSALARTAPHGSRPLEDVLSTRVGGEMFGASIVVVSAIVLEGLVTRLRQLAREGYSVTLLYTGDPPGPSIPDVRCFEIGGKRRWEDIAEQWGHAAN